MNQSAIPKPASVRAMRASRVVKERSILLEAEKQFAQLGFEGVSLESIAIAAGISRHNLLYYFPSKEALYRRVLDEVLGQWLEGMGQLSSGDVPHMAMSNYIAAKLRFSQERPTGTSIYTQEVMAGAPRYADAIVQGVLPLLQADIKRFESWAEQGQIKRVNFTHLMFVIWAMTQAYADLAPQFALLLGKPALDETDFEQARQLITELVVGTLARPSK